VCVDSRAYSRIAKVVHGVSYPLTFDDPARGSVGLQEAGQRGGGRQRNDEVEVGAGRFEELPSIRSGIGHGLLVRENPRSEVFDPHRTDDAACLSGEPIGCAILHRVQVEARRRVGPNHPRAPPTREQPRCLFV